MDQELFRNGSGYADFTAYKALQNVIKGESEMEYKRGEIYEYDTGRGLGGKALIVSADWRANDRILNLILLAEEKRHDNMIPIVCGGMMYADCEKVSFAWDERFGNYVRTARADEMKQIDECMARCLGLEQKVVEVEKIVEVEKVVEVEVERRSETPSPNTELMQELTELNNLIREEKAKAEVYEKLYKELLANVMKGSNAT